MKKNTAETVATTDQEVAIATNAARLLRVLNHEVVVDDAEYPTFISMDKLITIKRRPVSSEVFITLKRLPDRFAAQLKAGYEASINRRKEDADPLKNLADVPAEEYLKGLKELLIQTAVDPKFKEGDDDLPNNILSVDHVVAYLEEYYYHLMTEIAQRKVKLVKGMVSAEGLAGFFDGQQLSSGAGPGKRS